MQEQVAVVYVQSVEQR